MPQTNSAKKSLQTSFRKRRINDRWRKKVREALKDMRLAIDNDDKKALQETYIKAQSVVDRAARRKIIPKNKASRIKARLSKAIK